MIGELVGHVSCGLHLIKIKSFLIARCDELVTAVSLDNRATEASKASALEHRHRLDHPLGLSKEEFLHKHAS